MKLSSKIAYSIIIPGLFIITAFFALGYKSAGNGFYVVAFLLVVFLLLFGFYAGRQLSFPIKSVLETADELADGNLESRAKIHSIDEVNRLAQTVNSIANKLQVHQQEKEKHYYAVSARVHTATKPLSDAIEALEEKVKHRTLEMDRAKSASEKLQIVLSNKQAELTAVRNNFSAIMEEKDTDNISKEG